METMTITMTKRCNGIMMMDNEGNDDDSDSSSLLRSPDHHETAPLFHVLLLFYDCDPFIILPAPLSRPETLLCLPVSLVLILTGPSS